MTGRTVRPRTGHSGSGALPARRPSPAGPHASRRLALLAALLLLATGGVTGRASAACAAPALVVQDAGVASLVPVDVAMGRPLRVAGEGFLVECDDETTPGACSGPRGRDTDIVVELVQAGRAWPLATVDASRDGAFAVDVEFPADAQPGPAELRARGSMYAAEPAPVNILPAG